MLNIFHLFTSYCCFLFCKLFLFLAHFLLSSCSFSYQYLATIFRDMSPLKGLWQVASFVCPQFALWLHVWYFCHVEVWGFYVEEYGFEEKKKWFLNCEAGLGSLPTCRFKRNCEKKRTFKDTDSPMLSLLSWAGCIIAPWPWHSPWLILCHSCL